MKIGENNWQAFLTTQLEKLQHIEMKEETLVKKNTLRLELLSKFLENREASRLEILDEISFAAAYKNWFQFCYLVIEAFNDVYLLHDDSDKLETAIHKCQEWPFQDENLIEPLHLLLLISRIPQSTVLSKEHLRAKPLLSCLLEQAKKYEFVELQAGNSTHTEKVPLREMANQLETFLSQLK